MISHYQTKTNVCEHRYIKRISASPGFSFCGHLRDFHRLGGQQNVSARSLRSAKSQQNFPAQQNAPSCQHAKYAGGCTERKIPGSSPRSNVGGAPRSSKTCECTVISPIWRQSDFVFRQSAKRPQIEQNAPISIQKSECK